MMPYIIILKVRKFRQGFKYQWSTPLEYSMEYFWSTFGALLEYFWGNCGDIFWNTFGLPAVVLTAKIQFSSKRSIHEPLVRRLLLTDMVGERGEEKTGS